MKQQDVAYARGWELLKYFKTIGAHYILSDKYSIGSGNKMYFSKDYEFGEFDPSNLVTIELGEDLPDELLSEGLYMSNLLVGQGGNPKLLSLFREIGVVEFCYYDRLQVWSPDGDSCSFGEEEVCEGRLIILPSDIANIVNPDFSKAGLIYNERYGLVAHIKEQIIKAIEKGFFEPQVGREYKFKNPHNFTFKRYNYGKLIS